MQVDNQGGLPLAALYINDTGHPYILADSLDANQVSNAITFETLEGTSKGLAKNFAKSEICEAYGNTFPYAGLSLLNEEDWSFHSGTSVLEWLGEDISDQVFDEINDGAYELAIPEFGSVITACGESTMQTYLQIETKDGQKYLIRNLKVEVNNNHEVSIIP